MLHAIQFTDIHCANSIAVPPVFSKAATGGYAEKMLFLKIESLQLY